MNDNTIAPILRRSAMFSDVDHDTLETIAAASSYISLGKNEFLFMENDPVEAMFLLDTGRIRIFKTSMQGKEHVLHFVEPGEGFAEAALFGFPGYPADAQATRKSKIIRIPKRVFLEILDSDISFRDAIFRSMAIWLRRFADIIQSLTFKDVESRLVSYLLSQCKQTHGNIENNLAFELGIEKSMLASYLGTIPETLSRVLRKMQDSGLISVNRSVITLQDAQSLNDLISE